MFMRQKSSAHLCFSLGKAPGKYLWKPAPSATYWILRWGRDEQKKLWWRCWSKRKWGCSCSLGDLPSRCVAPMYCVNAAVTLHILISTCWVLPWQAITGKTATGPRSEVVRLRWRMSWNLEKISQQHATDRRFRLQELQDEHVHGGELPWCPVEQNAQTWALCWQSQAVIDNLVELKMSAD